MTRPGAAREKNSRFEDFFIVFHCALRCSRFSRHSLAILPPFRCNSPAFQIHFVALSRDFYRKFSALHGSLRQACLILGPGWVRRGREPSTPRRALSCLNDIATMNASYLALSCLEHVLLLCTTTKRDREFSSAVRAHTVSRACAG